MDPLNNLKKSIPAINKIDDKIDRISLSTRRTIRQSYFFLIFVLIIVGIIVGSRKGREAAGIHLPPLVENINDIFDTKMRQERGGNFDSLLRTEMNTSQKSFEAEKQSFQSREPLEMEYEGKIIDYKEDRPRAPEMQFSAKPLEGEYAAPMGKAEPQVKLLEKNTTPSGGITESAKPIERAPVTNENTQTKTNTKPAIDVPVIKKISPLKEEKKQTDNIDFSPLKDNTGIINEK